ncbi:wall associated kinase-like 1 [Artemisia annua]|uniref:Wall associated kinase-like 1 n=1 Tax=Artemisia annua TaxID=35608 RepID=A0A2U1KES7_ARTAN|nr:wall associated kinase-like 1 [Artemisia annua]
MKLPHLHVLITFISFTMAAQSLVPLYTKPGCTQMCGNISIPYPFGIEPNCFLNKWYAVDCKSSKPYLSSIQNLPLLAIDLNEQMVLVKYPMNSNCQTPQILNLDLGDIDNPFLFSSMHNKFMVEGCGKATISSGGRELTGCATICSHQSSSYRRNSCYGINCCQTSIQYYLKTYNVSLMSSDTQTRSKSCLSAFLMASGTYVNYLFPGHSLAEDNSSVPMVLRWTLPKDFDEESCGYIFSREKLNTGNDSSVSIAKCSCWSELEEGNPYLSGGCQVNEECTKCMRKGGFCGYKVSYGGIRTFVCDNHFHNGGSNSSSSRAIFLGVGISILVLILSAIGFASYKHLVNYNKAFVLDLAVLTIKHS